MLVAHIKNTENFGPSSSYYAPHHCCPPASLGLTLWYWGLGHRDHGKIGRELGCKRYHPGNKDWGWLYFSNQRGKGAAEEQAKPPQVSGEAQFSHRHGARWHRRGGRGEDRRHPAKAGWGLQCRLEVLGRTRLTAPPECWLPQLCCSGPEKSVLPE